MLATPPERMKVHPRMCIGGLLCDEICHSEYMRRDVIPSQIMAITQRIKLNAK